MAIRWCGMLIGFGAGFGFITWALVLCFTDPWMGEHMLLMAAFLAILNWLMGGFWLHRILQSRPSRSTERSAT
jgi:hypothetical protein